MNANFQEIVATRVDVERLSEAELFALCDRLEALVDAPMPSQKNGAAQLSASGLTASGLSKSGLK
jgi:hypothetical protein